MTARGDDDLFAESTMTFGEHLEELRGSLFRAIAGLAIGFVLGCLIANYVVAWIQTPVLQALQEYEQKHARRKLTEQYEGTLPPEVERMLDAGYVPHETMLIEPFGFLEQLQADYPDLFQLDVTPHKFIAEDFKPRTEGILGTSDPAKALAARLIADGAATADSPGKQIWDRLSDGQRDYLKKLAADDESTENDRVQLAAIFNQLVDKGDLHRSAAFEAIKSFNDKVTKEGVKELRGNREKKEQPFPSAIRGG